MKLTADVRFWNKSEHIYMSQKVEVMFRMMKPSISFATQNLKDENSEAKHIRFNWKVPVNSVFWRHVTTACHIETWITVNDEIESLMKILYCVTHYVPTTIFVSASVWSLPKLLAIPKSEILGFISWSSKMLLALRSLWIILSIESWWR